MTTLKQKLGEKGELLIIKMCICPKCKRKNTLRRLPVNFKCADIICDFCGYLAQVKTKNVKNIDRLPNDCLGAAWMVQKERMDAGIYFPLYLVLVAGKKFNIFYLSADLQSPELFKMRTPLTTKAKRAGWQGFTYNFRALPANAFVRLI
jgi:hypothetical protein